MTSPSIDRITGLGPNVAVKAPCRVASLVNVPLLSGLLTISSVVTAAGDRVLVAGQTDATQNGIYLASVGDWPRAPDADDTRDFVHGTRVYVFAGDNQGDFQCTTDGIIAPGADAIAFAGTVGTVASVFGRAGVVLALAGDYTASKITNDSGIAGATTKDALNTLGAAIVLTQPLDGDLTALAALAGTGLATKTGVNAWTTRSLAAGAGLSVANADGVAANPTISLGGELAAVAGFAAAGFASRAGANTWNPRTLTVAADGAIAITNADGAAANPAFAVSINSLTVDNAPDPADYLMFYDVSGTVLRKVQVSAIGGGGGGAPTGASYVTLGTDATLTAERVLTAGTGISLTDAGAGSTLTVAISDAELLALAGLVSAADKLPYFTGSGTASLADITSFSRTRLGDSTSSAWRAGLGLAIGSDVQAYDAELAALAGLVSAADRVPYFSGSGTAALATFTAAGRTLVAAADAAAETALFNAFTGDSGAGGVKGLVPAPAAGDAAASKVLGAGGGWVVPGSSGALVGVRLTLQSGVAVMTTTQSAKTTVYCTPYLSQYVPLYDGTNMNATDLGGELSQATTDATKSPAACTPYTAYDVFAWDNAGTKRATRGPKWSVTATITMTIAAPGVVSWTAHGLLDGMTVSFTNAGGALPTGITAGTDYFITKVDANSFKLSTTLANQVAGTYITTTGTQSGVHTGENRTQARGTGAGTSELVRVKGVYLNANNITNGAAAQRGTYIGTVVTNGSSQVDWIFGGSAAGGTAAFFGVFNAYNQFPVATYIQNSTSAYTYATAAWRAANASAGTRCTFVRGLDVGEVRAVHSTVVTAGTAVKASGIGLDSITAPSGTVVPVSGSQPGDAGEVQHYFGTTLGIGQHYLSVIEWGGASCQFNVITSPTSNGLLVSVGL